MADKVMKMPVNYEAEQAMLGSIMMDTNVANDFTTLLREIGRASCRERV